MFSRSKLTILEMYCERLGVLNKTIQKISENERVNNVVNVPNACQLLIITSQRANKRANVP